MHLVYPFLIPLLIIIYSILIIMFPFISIPLSFILFSILVILYYLIIILILLMFINWILLHLHIPPPITFTFLIIHLPKYNINHNPFIYLFIHLLFSTHSLLIPLLLLWLSCPYLITLLILLYFYLYRSLFVQPDHLMHYYQLLFPNSLY